uniref:Suppressor of cytokine signaling at 36E (inferred by orthology to a D. melanogaster protein) n=1 Tax=Anisakis simplex TaxID=6269 RepID=A0A0M3K9E8_ANISI
LNEVLKGLFERDMNGPLNSFYRKRVVEEMGISMTFNGNLEELNYDRVIPEQIRMRKGIHIKVKQQIITYLIGYIRRTRLTYIAEEYAPELVDILHKYPKHNSVPLNLLYQIINRIAVKQQWKRYLPLASKLKYRIYERRELIIKRAANNIQLNQHLTLQKQLLTVSGDNNNDSDSNSNDNKIPIASATAIVNTGSLVSPTQATIATTSATTTDTSNTVQSNSLFERNGNSLSKCDTEEGQTAVSSTTYALPSSLLPCSSKTNATDIGQGPSDAKSSTFMETMKTKLKDLNADEMNQLMHRINEHYPERYDEEKNLHWNDQVHWDLETGETKQKLKKQVQDYLKRYCGMRTSRINRHDRGTAVKEHFYEFATRTQQLMETSPSQALTTREVKFSRASLCPCFSPNVSDDEVEESDERLFASNDSYTVTSQNAVNSTSENGNDNRASAQQNISSRGNNNGDVIIQDEPYVVHSSVDYTNCLVPKQDRITASCYYWGVMDRYEAEALLENKPEGTFLLRDSAQSEYLFSVSFRRYKRTLHARIEQKNHRFSFDFSDTSIFSADNIIDLIAYYNDPAKCLFFEPQLSIPLPRNFVFSLQIKTFQHICRSYIASLTCFDGVNQLNLPVSLKQYIQEYYYKHPVKTVNHAFN